MYILYNNKSVNFGNRWLEYIGGVPPDPEVETGYWVHKTSKVVTEFDSTDSSIIGTTFNTPSWKNDASEIRLPAGITTISNNALAESPDLVTLILPSSISTVGNNILSNTPSFEHLHSYALTAPTLTSLGTDVGDYRLQIKVEADSFDSYRSASGWSGYIRNLFVLNDLIPGSRVHSGYTVRTQNLGYNAANNIVIENLHFNNPTDIISFPYAALSISNSSNIIIRNCKFTNMDIMQAISLRSCSNITIYNCDFESVHAGVRADSCTNSIRIFSNDFKNILGTSQGGLEPGQAVQLRNNPEATGEWFIQDNAVENIAGESYAEDNMNTFNCHFEVDKPLRIRNNRLRGGGPSVSGGGIIIGDNHSMVGNNQVVEDNVVVNPGQYGVSIAGGSNMTLQRNIVFGEQNAWSNVGVIVANWDSPPPITNLVVRENRVHWTNSDGNLNPAWAAPELAGVISGSETNVLNDVTVTPAILPTQIIGI